MAFIYVDTKEVAGYSAELLMATSRGPVGLQLTPDYYVISISDEFGDVVGEFPEDGEDALKTVVANWYDLKNYLIAEGLLYDHKGTVHHS